jgi:hypothetical protein
LHVHAFELPREWHDVYCMMGAIPLDHGQPRTHTHTPTNYTGLCLVRGVC